jgi:DNA-binding IclR family transcriptional regulator
MLETVARAVAVIKYVGEKPRTLTEVANHLGTHKSTALRLLQTLEQTGFARQNDAGRYTIGFELVSIAQNALDNVDLYTVAHPRLVALSKRLGYTLHLGHLVDHDVVYLDKIEGRGAVKMYSRVGTTAMLHTSAISKAIIAYLDEPLLDEILAKIDYKPYTSTTLTSPPAFARELTLTSERGWAEDNGEFEDFINCVAVPIRGANGKVRAAMSLTALRALATLETLRGSVAEISAVAEDISRECGWIG